MTRTLTLKRESLAELSIDDLRGVAGGQAITLQGLTCPLDMCFLDSNMGMCYSWIC